MNLILNLFSTYSSALFLCLFGYVLAYFSNDFVKLTVNTFSKVELK